MRFTVRTGDLDFGVFPSREWAEKWAEENIPFLKYAVRRLSPGEVIPINSLQRYTLRI